MNGVVQALLWIIGAGALGFVIAAVFAGLLRMPRASYLLVYIPLTSAFLVLFAVEKGIDLARIVSHNWIWGVAGAAVCGAVVVRHVLTQPSSPRSRGFGLMLDVIWPGLVYGIVDGLFLSVLPILAVWTAGSGATWTGGPAGRVGLGVLALAASCYVAAAYHLGYPEFRGRRLGWAVFGNAVMSSAYLLTSNPLAAVLPHAAMHIAAIVHGRDTTVQLPPHAASRQDRT